MASAKFVLCHKTINPIDKPIQYCGQPITQKNPALNWCEPCRVSLPIWPQSEANLKTKAGGN